GIYNTVLEPGEVVVRAAIPIVPGRRSAFEKLRRRGAIDYPLLSVAVRADLDPDDRAKVSAVDVVVSALGARPRRIRTASKWSPGASGASLPDTMADAAFAE